MSGYGNKQRDYDSRTTASGYVSLQQQQAGGYAYSSSASYASLPATSLPQQQQQQQQQPTARQPVAHEQSSNAAGLAQPLFGSRSSQRYALQPEDLSCFPEEGAEGDDFTVYLGPVSDLMNPGRQFRLDFGNRKVRAELKVPDSNRGEVDYRLEATVPIFPATGWTESRVPVYLVTEDEDGSELSSVQAGTFTYKDNTQHGISSPPKNQMKRKHSVGSDVVGMPVKRHSTQIVPAIRPKSEDYGYAYPAAHQYPGHYSGNNGSISSRGTSGDGRSYGLYSGYDNQDHGHSAAAYPPQSSPRGTLAYAPYAGSAETSQHATQSWQTSAAPITRSVMPSPEHHILPGPVPADTGNPTLIRTSTLQQSHGAGGTGTGAFNPYSITFPQKAILKINGDLAEMGQHWTGEEWESKRRLVRFWREQKGNTVHTQFRPVAPNEKQPNMICVSCIWWQEKEACYITSVDCISLLESLIAVRFTVEEKNRIRRNLEGFRPETVSKARAESENFFKLIMSFPNPKPRNIEKDVKVFPWSILPHALKKIIGKYSASYSSTASVIPPSPASVYPSNPHPSADHSQLDPRTTSSPSLPDPTTSSAPLQNLAAPLAQGSALASPISLGRVSGTTDAQIPLPLITTPSSHIWQQHSLPPAPHAAIPSLRGSWDVPGSYLDHGPASAPPTSSQAVYYERAPIDNREPVSTGVHTPHSTQQQQQPLANINVP